MLNTEIQANKGAIFTFSLPGEQRAPLPPSVTSLSGNYSFYCILTTLNKVFDWVV